MPTAQHSRTKPRSWFGIFFAAGGWIAVISAVILIGLTVASVIQYRSAATFERDGLTVEAQVIDKRIRRTTDDTDYYVTLAYIVDGTTYRREHDVGSGFYHDVEVGGSTPVRYLPSNPSVVEHYPGERQDAATTMQWIAGAIGLFALFNLWITGRRANRAVLARRYGYSSTAKVHEIIERRSKGRPTGKGYMVFRTADGPPQMTLDGDVERFLEIGEGAEIAVFVRGKTAWWEGDTGPRPEKRNTVPKVG